MVHRAALVLVVALAVTAIAFATMPGARATHWCGQVTVSISPPVAPANATATFQIGVMYRGNGTLALTRVTVRFSWEGADRDLGAGSIPAGETRTFPVVATPTRSGPWTVDVRLLGQAPADTVDGLCAYPVPLGPVSQDVFSGLAFLGLVLLICAAIVIVIIVVIIVVIVLLAKRPPTQPVYPYPPPLAGSPWALAPFPPPSPPPEPPQPPKFRGT